MQPPRVVSGGGDNWHDASWLGVTMGVDGVQVGMKIPAKDDVKRGKGCRGAYARLLL